MIILNRKPGQTIKIGDDITITLIRDNFNRTSLGIEAPRHLKVLRGELESAKTTPPHITTNAA